MDYESIYRSKRKQLVQRRKKTKLHFESVKDYFSKSPCESVSQRTTDTYSFELQCTSVVFLTAGEYYNRSILALYFNQYTDRFLENRSTVSPFDGIKLSPIC